MLRQYQKDLIISLRNEAKKGYKNLVAVLPTGAGKTFTFCYIIKGSLARNKKVLIITDRIELLKQAGGALNSYDMDPIKIEAGRKPPLSGTLYTAMVETLFRRLKKEEYQHWIHTMNLIIIDECHMRAFDKIFGYLNPDCTIIGFTATPKRQGKKDQLGEYYEKLVIGVEIDYLVKEKYLAKPKYYGVPTDLSGIRSVRGDYDQNEVADRFSRDKIYRGVVENWMNIAPNQKTLCFSSNIASSKELAEEFRTVTENVRHLDSEMSKTKRADILTWFKNTPTGVLCNVGILTKGFDEPSIQTIILYRATRSIPLYLQMVGRGSRIHDNKTTFNILDFGENISRHGFWHENRPWNLDIEQERKKEEGDMVLKNCKKCGAFIPVRAIRCDQCGFIDLKEKSEQEFAELQLLDPWILNQRAMKGSIDDKVKLAKQKLVKASFIMHKMRDFDEVIEFVTKMGYKRYWWEMNYHRYWWANEYLKRRKQ